MMGKEETPPADGGGAFAFISKGWREVRDSASADLRLMRARADSVRARADRELEHLLASAASALTGPAPPLPPVATGAPIAEVEFVRRRIQPKIQELRRHCSSRAPDARWPPGAAPAPGASSLRIDLSGITAIRNAIVAEGDRGGRWRVARRKGDQDEEGRKEWEVVRVIQSGLKEFERRSLSSGIFAGFRGRGEFVEKFKFGMVIFNRSYLFNRMLHSRLFYHLF
jgi:digalactosyldiacylglycerol synthase